MRIERLRPARVLVHHPGQEHLIQRAPVDPYADRFVVLDRAADDRRKLLIAPLSADVPRIDAELGEGGGAVGMAGKEDVPVEMEVADERDIQPLVFETPRDLGHGRGGARRVHRDADDFGARLEQCPDLIRRGRHVRRIGVRHRLDDDRVGAAHADASDVDRSRRAA